MDGNEKMRDPIGALDAMEPRRMARMEQSREEFAWMKGFLTVMAICVVAIIASSIAFHAITLSAIIG